MDLLTHRKGIRHISLTKACSPHEFTPCFLLLNADHTLLGAAPVGMMQGTVHVRVKENRVDG